MEPHILELRDFVGRNVFIQFSCGTQKRSKEAFIRKFTGFRLFLEGIHDPSGRTYKIKVPQILEIKSLEKSGKIWRK